MKYIINNNIKYHEDKSELELLHADAEPIVLTGTLNRLLSALVRNNNVILSREALLTQVWEDHGQVASGNNLNNSISMLRKIFTSLGVEEIIVTLPRQGFMFTTSSLNTAEDSLPVLALPTLVTKSSMQVPTGLLLKKALLPIIALLALAAAAVAWRSTEYAVANYKHVGMLGLCDIRLVTTHHQTDPREINLAQLQTFLTESGIQCEQPATVYYYSGRALVPSAGDLNTVISVAYCPKNELVSGAIQCESIYENKHG